MEKPLYFGPGDNAAHAPKQSPHTRMLLALTPDATLLLLTAGVLLLYVEFNRPGLVLPGACGLTLALLAIACCVRLRTPSAAALAGLLGFTLLALSTRTRTHLPLALAATAALLYAFLHLTPESSNAQPGTAVAVLCALFLGLGTSLLTTIAARARQNKGLDLSPFKRRV